MKDKRLKTVVYVKDPADGFCPQCVNTKRVLTTSGVVFEERMIGDEERTMLRARGFMMAPVVEVTQVSAHMFEGVPGVIEIEGGVSWCGLVPPALDRLKSIQDDENTGDSATVDTVPA